MLAISKMFLPLSLKEHLFKQKYPPRFSLIVLNEEIPCEFQKIEISYGTVCSEVITRLRSGGIYRRYVHLNSWFFEGERLTIWKTIDILTPPMKSRNILSNLRVNHRQISS